MLLEEAYRTVAIREGDKVIELPVIKAVFRSLGVSAMKGNRLAQATMAELVRGVEEEDRQLRSSHFETACEYKISWEQAIEHARKHGLPEPTPVPHPDDIILDTRRDLIMGVAGGAMLASGSSAGMAMKPAAPPTSIEQLIALEAIKYRKARYAYCVDHKDWDGFAANFTDDASWDIRGAMNPRNPVTGEWTGVSELSEDFLRSTMIKVADWPVIGRKNIGETAKRISGPTSTSAHKLFTPMIDILSDTDARAIWPFEDESYKDPSRPIRYANGVGYYHETYAKVGKDWLIKSTTVERTFLVAQKRIG